MRCLLTAHDTQEGGPVPPQQPQIRREAARLACFARGSRGLKLDYMRPSSGISVAMIRFLDGFADAGRGRYANFAALGNPNLGREEPIRKWWEEVAKLILEEHYYGKTVQEKVEGRARLADELMSPVSVILYFDEEQQVMRDVRSAFIRSGQTELVQRYGRFYALTVIRWLSDIFSELSRLAADVHDIRAFYGVWEHFDTYRVDSAFLKNRKVWPLH